MRGVNKVILVGTLGRDPEVRYAANGNAIANLNIATSEQWNDRATGDKQERTEWHRVVIFGKLAEIAQQYLKKGSKVYLEGKLQTRKWQDTQTQQDRYATEVVIDIGGTMQMLGGGPDNQPQEGMMSSNARHKTVAPAAGGVSFPKVNPPSNTRDNHTMNDYDDFDVPF